MTHFVTEPAARQREEREARATALGVTRGQFDFIFGPGSGTKQFVDQLAFTDRLLDQLAATTNQQERDKILLAVGGNNPAFSGLAAGVAARKEIVKIGRRRGFTSTIRGGAAGGRSFLQPLGGGGLSPESQQFLGG